MTIPIIAKQIDADGQFPNQNRRLRLGIVGGGRISLIQSMAARLTNRWEIVAGALSADPKKSITRAREILIQEDRCYSSFEKMAELEAQRHDGIDAVMITTPNDLHYSVACSFLNQGIDVMCDKPMTNEVSEAEELVKLTSKNSLIFAVGYIMSCFPMIRQARQIVKDEGIGQVKQIHVEFLQDWMIPASSVEADHVRWRLDPSRTGKTSCIGDIGTHAAHLVSFLTGMKLTHLLVEAHVCGAPKPLEDTAFMFTRHADKIPGTLLITRLATGNRAGLRLRVFGSQGGLEWNLEKPEQLQFNCYGKPDQIISRGQGHGVSQQTERLIRTARGFSEGIIEAWANLYTEFALAVAARRDGIDIPSDWLEFPDVNQGAEGVRFVDASVRSISSAGKWVEI